MPDLFDENVKKTVFRPLAERLRPQALDEIVGQSHLLGPKGPLRLSIEKDRVPSMILWGPPGSGKTTLARVVANTTGAAFHAMSGVAAGVKEVKAVVEKAHDDLKFHQKRTILFLDEIHRFNKSQQDAFLPYVEDGTLTLIGATTENPSFEVNSALLSRMRVFVLQPLDGADIKTLLLRACEREGWKDRVAGEVLELLAAQSFGDARFALNTLELAVSLAGEGKIGRAQIEAAMQKKALLYDRSGEEHYNIISALHKSIRGSDPQAALYYFYRMIEGGEDPLYLARRLIRIASEDVGLADPQALPLCVAAKEAFHMLGNPEGVLALAESAVYLALAPKSNRLYTAEAAVKAEIKATGPLPPPHHIRNAPTKLMKGLGYGEGYQYDHDQENAFSGQDYFPGGLHSREFYAPGELGFEREMKKRMEYFKKLKEGKSEHP